MNRNWDNQKANPALNTKKKKQLQCKATVKPLFSDHKEQDIFLCFQTDGYFLLYESSTEISALLSFSNKQPPVNSDVHFI